MGKFDGFLFCSDVDGTLTNSRGELSAENADAIRRFQAEGGLFTLSTGRYPQFAKKFAPDFVPNAPLISVGGTLLYDCESQTILYTRTLGDEVFSILDTIEQECPYVYTVYFGCGLAGEKPVHRENGRFVRPSDVTPPWQKIVLCLPAAEMDRCKALLIPRFGADVEFNMSWSEGLEIHAKGSGKGDAIAQMRRLFPAVHTVVAAGDYENDISMLRAADISYAVGNALPCVKEAATRVTVTNDEHAIARIIRELEETL